MTKASASLPVDSQKTISALYYQVAMPQPTNHLFEVTLVINNWQAETLDLKMPVWTPGSYLVREYTKNVQDFIAFTEDEEPLISRKIAKNHWQIKTGNNQKIIVSYRVFANEHSVRTNHLNASHGYFNGAALFFFIPHLEKVAFIVKIIPPQTDWQVTTTLPPIAGENNTFKAIDFDTLVDSPFEIGLQKIFDFSVLDKTHQLAIWGEGNYQPQKLIKDIQKIIEVEANLYGGLPYERYLFLLHLSANGYGGLEHKDSCSLIYPRFNFRNRDKYYGFMQLVAHEFFHLWNVKRIRPSALEEFDYEKENYTTSLWFSEGTTSYYDIVIPQRAGIYDVKTFMENLSKEITRYLNIPGRKVQSVTESSFDAWIKLYRRDANSDNCQISYYLKGQLISLLLDLLIRSQHNNQRSLDDVMRLMWSRFGQAEIGFTAEQLQEVIESVAARDLSDFFKRYVDGTDELPFSEYLEPFGLRIKAIVEEDPAPYLGIKVVSENGKQIIKFVEASSPAQIAGIDTDNELLAIEGIRVTADQLNERLKDYRIDDIIQITVFHSDELRTRKVKLAAPQPSRYEIAQIQYPSSAQKQNFAGWFLN